MRHDSSNLLQRHRSIRRYKSDAIDPRLIDQVCGDAIAGGSWSSNLNAVSIMLTRDAGRRHGARDNFDNLIGYHAAALDAIIVAQNVCLGFEARGLGICYMGETLNSMGAISQLFELEDACVPVTTVVVGHPDEVPGRSPWQACRLPLPAFLHDETYRPQSDDEIDATYAEREQLGWERYMAMPELKARMGALGVTSLAQFYTSEAKYGPEVLRKDSAALRALLEAKHSLP